MYYNHSYLPAFPYQDNPLLHLYAGLISLHLSQPSLNEEEEVANRISSVVHLPNRIGQSAKRHGNGFNPNLLRDAQAYFERAKELDPENTLTQAFLARVFTSRYVSQDVALNAFFQLPKLLCRFQGNQNVELDSDDNSDDGQNRLKRFRA